MSVGSRVTRRKQKSAIAAKARNKKTTAALILANSQRSSDREKEAEAWARTSAPVFIPSGMWDGIVATSRFREPWRVKAHVTASDERPTSQPHNAMRSREATQDGRVLRRHRRRWKIERLFAWLHNFRRIVIRWDY